MFGLSKKEKLFNAIQSDKLWIVEQLLNDGISPNTVRGNSSAIFEAVKRDNYEIVNSLINHGANIRYIKSGKNSHSKVESLLQLAVQTKSERITELLIQNGLDVHQSDKDGNGVIHYAAESGCLGCLNHLLENGVEIHALNKKNATPLHYACKKGHQETVSYLIKKGADVNVIDIKGQTPLMCSVESGNYNLVKTLLNAGANVDAEEENGHTALSIAIKKSFAEIRELLIQSGAEFNKADKDSTYIQKIINQYQSSFNSGRVIFPNNINSDQSNRIKMHITPDIYMVQPLFFVDFTYSKDSSSGLLITDRKLYFKYKNAHRSIKLSDIKNIEIKSSFFSGMKKLVVNGEEYPEFGVSQSAAGQMVDGSVPFERIIDLLNSILKYFKFERNKTSASNQEKSNDEISFVEKEPDKKGQVSGNQLDKNKDEFKIEEVVEEYRDSYFPAVFAIILSGVALYASYFSNWEYHLVIGFSNISWGWLGLVIGFFLLVRPPKYKL